MVCTGRLILVFEDFFDSDLNGIDFSIPSGSGVLTLGEFGYITGNYQNIPGLPGKYKIGAYYDSERLQELSTDRNVRGTWGLYILGEQMLYSENSDYSEGLSAFLALRSSLNNPYAKINANISSDLLGNRP